MKPSAYANDVLEIATALRGAPATEAMALSMARPARLESRLRLIVEAASNRTALTGWIVAGALALILGAYAWRVATWKPRHER